MSLLSKYSNTEDIRKVIETRARAYVPEWRFNPDDPDAATALALAFADMFGETSERLERVPYRYFLYFLNMLETRIRSVSPATGLASFTLVSNAEKGKLIPENTQLYANVVTNRGESERVTFETTREITASPAQIMHMYSVDPRHDVINPVDFENGGTRLFYADKDNNLQVHRFSIWHSDVLNIVNPARITLRLENAFARYEGGKNNERLTNPEFAKWTYERDGIKEEFSKVYLNEGAIILELDGLRGLVHQPGNAPEEPPALEDEPHIVCTMSPDGQESGIMADKITLGSAYLYPKQSGVHIVPDYVYHNDILLRPREPGYLFGKEPGKFDSMLISCDEVFGKRGARIDVTFVMHTVIREVGKAPDGPVYNWDGRFVIDKADSETVIPDNIYISDVVWEYWNGVGWAHLETDSSNLNIFKGDENVRHESISFVCPEDMAPSYQNSIWGCWIRSRITEIENPLSQYGRWQLPFAESISFVYDYGAGLKNASHIKLENNAESQTVTEKETGIGLSLYKPLLYPEHAIYIAFDKQPAGLPLSVYVGLGGVGGRARTLSFERMIRDAAGDLVFKPCKALDETNGLKDSGVISLYVSEDMSQGRIFSREAYWLRIVDGDLRFEDNAGTSVLDRIELNAAEIMQRESVSNQYYSTDLFETGKVITLPDHPILSCEVCVDEYSDAGGQSVAGTQPDETGAAAGGEIEYDEDGSILHKWVKWDIVPSLMGRGSNERVVSLDSAAGVLRFGDGTAGRVPPSGTQNIRINYSFGGGAIGNIAPGTIAGLSSSIQTIYGATNFTSTGGGSDNISMSVLEKIGPARIHHRGRAVTLDDFENLVLEEFPEAAAVKAFAGIDTEGNKANSSVTVVILPKDADNREQVLKLCKRAYNYLTSRAHCQLIASSNLAVVPALMMTVNVIVEAVAEDITRAAATERAIQNAISARLTGDIGMKIGRLPAEADIFDCLRGIPNVSYVDRILLEGQYFEGSRQILTPLGKGSKFPFACAKNGTHVVRFN